MLRSISHRFWCAIFIIFPFTFLKSQASTLCLRVFFCNVAYFWFLLTTSSIFLYFIDPASRYNRVKETQPDVQLILSIFRERLHVSGLSRPIIRRYNRMYTTIGTFYSF